MEANTQSNWFVGAMWGEDQTDQTPRFLEEGVWELGYDYHERFQRQVRSMRPEDRIAIKAVYNRRRDLPFDNRDETVAVMHIKAIGRITQNLRDGKRVRVDWEEQDTRREWFFSTYWQSIHRIQPGVDWKKDGLLAFTFGGVPQDIDRFRNDDYWRDRFGDEDDPDGEDEGRQEEAEQEDRPAGQDIAPCLPDLDEIERKVEKAGHFPENLCRQLHCGLWANDRRHFAILTGLSGSGKTLLGCEYGKALTGGQQPYFCIVPVQPGWTDPSFLLGYLDPLKGDSYVRTRFLKLLVNAGANPAEPHVAILDEMNLSHPEQYLAPVLSAMETGREVELHGGGDEIDGVPPSIPYPGNLVLIGTVNMDETTMGFSDKVLDRAHTIEFWDMSVDDWPGWDSCRLEEEEKGRVEDVLKDLMKALKDARLHFGYRTIEEVVAFIEQRNALALDWEFGEALDAVIHAKVLPKLRGDDSPRIRDAFAGCRDVLRTHALGGCLARVEELRDDLEATGSARFWR